MADLGTGVVAVEVNGGGGSGDQSGVEVEERAGVEMVVVETIVGAVVMEVKAGLGLVAEVVMSGAEFLAVGEMMLIAMAKVVVGILVRV